MLPFLESHSSAHHDHTSYKGNSVIPKRVVLLVKKSGKFGLNGIYIVNSVNRGKITMTGFDPIFGITGYHLMLRYNGVRYNGVHFVYSPLLKVCEC